MTSQKQQMAEIPRGGDGNVKKEKGERVRRRADERDGGEGKEGERRVSAGGDGG